MSHLQPPTPAVPNRRLARLAPQGSPATRGDPGRGAGHAAAGLEKRRAAAGGIGQLLESWGDADWVHPNGWENHRKIIGKVGKP